MSSIQKTNNGIAIIYNCDNCCGFDAKDSNYRLNSHYDFCFGRNQNAEREYFSNLQKFRCINGHEQFFNLDYVTFY